jgi:hypothetical protein
VGKFGVGAKKQENLPHYIEVVSSLAAFDFYEQPEIKEQADKMLFTAVAKAISSPGRICRFRATIQKSGETNGTEIAGYFHDGVFVCVPNLRQESA